MSKLLIIGAIVLSLSGCIMFGHSRDRDHPRDDRRQEQHDNQHDDKHSDYH